MKLPNPEQTIIDDSKLVGYCLNPNHVDGKHKARVFKSALNITIENAEELKLALFNAVKKYDALLDKSNLYGQKYTIDFPLTRENKTATIHSVWIIKNNEQFARLITCYVV